MKRRTIEARELSPQQEKYSNFFFAMLDQYGVSSPAKLSAEKKSEFFNAIRTNWKKYKNRKWENIQKDMEKNNSVKTESKMLRNIKEAKRKIMVAEGDRDEFKQFFLDTMKEFGVESPAELDDEKKAEFFDAIDKGWKAVEESKNADMTPLTEGGDSSKLKTELAQLKKAYTVLKGSDSSVTKPITNRIAELEKLIKQESIRKESEEIPADQEDVDFVKDIVESAGFKLTKITSNRQKNKLNFVIEGHKKTFHLSYDDNDMLAWTLRNEYADKGFRYLQESLGWLDAQFGRHAEKMSSKAKQLIGEAYQQKERTTPYSTLIDPQMLPKAERERRLKRGNEVMDKMLKNNKK